MQKVTINVVAAQAGVSKKTVSRVLNDEPNVSEATKAKVRAVFELLDYRPSSVARGLASNQSFLIGLIYDNPNKSYVSDAQEGSLSVCNETGYHLVIHPTDHQSEQLLIDIEKLLVESRLDGVVLTPPFSDMAPIIELLTTKTVPFVRVGATQNLPSSSDSGEAPCVISNDEVAAFQMTQHLISLGHRKIGFIKGHPDHNVSAQRFNGYCQALEASGLELNQDWLAEGLFDFASGELAARKLLACKRPPSAIFASNDYMAAGVLKIASQEKVAVPHDLSVAGFDNAPISSYIWPSLTTVKQPVKAMVSAASRLLIDRIRKRPVAKNTVQLDSELIIRASTAPLRQ